jgi:hypothetical protein
MPQQDQHSVLYHLTGYLNLMEKAMSSPFILFNVTAQFKQFLHKHPQTRPHVFTLATGIDKAVEGKVDFPSFRAAVSSYMQDFLMFADPPLHLGTLYSSQIKEEEPVAPKIKIITKQQPQQSYNPKEQRQHQQHVRFQIVNDPNTYTSSTPPSMSSSPSQINPFEDNTPYDCKYFHTAKGCKFGTRANPDLCKFLHSAAIGRPLRFMEEQEPRISVSEPHPKRLRLQSSIQGAPAAPRGEAGVCFNFKNRGKCFRGSTCRYSHEMDAQQ